MDEWDFYFEQTGLGATEGANIPSAEFFTTKEFEDHLVREMIQNSIDAKAGHGPVRVEFETMTLETDSLPGIATLREAAARAEEGTEGDEGNGALAEVVSVASQQTISVLRIGDYGTKGLTGKESKDSPKSALSTLTRGVGVSSSNPGRGGSFGIGSAVTMVGSAMRTVAYVSLPEKEHEQVFTMTARLASHRDKNNVDRAATGFYIRLGQDDFVYKRDPERHAPFPARTELGTDTYILGYLPPNEADSLELICRAAVKNFFVAILEGDLEVAVMGSDKTVVIDAQAIRKGVGYSNNLSAEVAPFIRAYETEESLVIRKRLKHTGDCELRIHFDPDMEEKSAALLMRKPKMLITTYKPQFPFRYAAIFICRDEEGDDLLRHTEPAQHDKWSTDGVRGHSQAVTEIRNFIRDTIKDMAPDVLQSSTTVAGLAKLLPKPAEATPGAAGGASDQGRADPSAPSRPSAGGARRPLPGAVDDAEVANIRPVAVPVVSSATAGAGTRPGMTGFGTRPSSKRKQKKAGGKPTPVGGTDGDSRRLERVSMRSFVSAGTDTTTVVLTSEYDQHGDLALRARGLDGTLSKPSIISVTQRDEGASSRQLEVADGAIKDVSLVAGTRTLLEVAFAGGATYALTVEGA